MIQILESEESIENQYARIISSKEMVYQLKDKETNFAPEVFGMKVATNNHGILMVWDGKTLDESLNLLVYNLRTMRLLHNVTLSGDMIIDAEYFEYGQGFVITSLNLNSPRVYYYSEDQKSLVQEIQSISNILKQKYWRPHLFKVSILDEKYLLCIQNFAPQYWHSFYIQAIKYDKRSRTFTRLDSLQVEPSHCLVDYFYKPRRMHPTQETDEIFAIVTTDLEFQQKHYAYNSSPVTFRRYRVQYIQRRLISQVLIEIVPPITATVQSRLVTQRGQVIGYRQINSIQIFKDLQLMSNQSIANAVKVEQSVIDSVRIIIEQNAPFISNSSIDSRGTLKFLTLTHNCLELVTADEREEYYGRPYYKKAKIFSIFNQDPQFITAAPSVSDSIFNRYKPSTIIVNPLNPRQLIAIIRSVKSSQKDCSCFLSVIELDEEIAQFL